MTHYDRIHAERFQRSLEWLSPWLAPGMSVLEAGGETSFTASLKQDFGVDVVTTDDRDLRKPFPASEIMRSVSKGVWAPMFDVAVCMEVLEHVNDRDEKPVATEWRGTGADQLLRTLHTALKPGGILFLTTPNACSQNVLLKLLTMRAPMMYRPHVREYAPAELVAMLTGIGFTIERFATLDVWHDVGNAAQRSVMAKLLAHFPSPHRGEDIFVIARKPESQPAKPASDE